MLTKQLHSLQSNPPTLGWIFLWYKEWNKNYWHNKYLIINIDNRKFSLECAYGKKRVIAVTSEAGEQEIGKALGKLERVSLHHIRWSEEIHAICNEVISRTEGAIRLLRITPERLEKLKEEVKKKVRVQVNQEANPVEISEVEAMEQNARIRKDWDSSRWKKNPPRWWAWREEWEKKWKKKEWEKEIIALVYETKARPGEHELFIDKEIYAHPRWALVLIENMRKRHKALMAWDKKQGKKWKK